MSPSDDGANGRHTGRRRLKVLVSINTSWNIANFRGGLVRALTAAGFDVVAASPVDEYTVRLAQLGCRHVPFEMDNKGTNPVRDASLLLSYLQLLRRERPDVFLRWTIKPNVYGSIAARLRGIPFINNVSGLGTAFIRTDWLTRVVKTLYRIAFRRSAMVFFQNHEDRALFVDARLINERQTSLLPGSGIDLEYYRPAAPRDGTSGPVFLLVARLLRDKGIVEFVEAARLVKARFPRARFRLLGFLDVENRTAITREAVEEWVRSGDIEYLGKTEDVRPHIAAADCVVLPSYREGTPRSLLEASAMARPIIATDVPGCREVVEDGVTGLLCRPQDASDLAARMIEFAGMAAEDRAKMGAAGRARMEHLFDERIVIDAYLQAIGRAIQARSK